MSPMSNDYLFSPLKNKHIIAVPWASRDLWRAPCRTWRNRPFRLTGERRGSLLGLKANQMIVANFAKFSIALRCSSSLAAAQLSSAI